MYALRARLLCSPALICLSLVVTGGIAIAQDAAPQPPAAVQDAQPPAGAQPAAPGSNTLPQVEVISADAPKPPKKTAPKKKTSSPVKQAAPAAQPVEQATDFSDQVPNGAQGTQSDAVTNAPAGAFSAINDYVAAGASTATKTATPLKETPQSISVVGKEQFRDQGARTVQETLRYVPGVLADGFGFDSRGDFAIVRGIEASYFLDGMSMPKGYYVNRAAIDPYTLDRVEVLRGPASMLYGQGSTGGLINAVSKKPEAEAHREIPDCVRPASKLLSCLAPKRRCACWRPSWARSTSAIAL